MNGKSLSRRTLLAAATVAASAATVRSATTMPGPPKRTGGPHLRVGCCAYSYRDFLTGHKAPHMSLTDFVERAAEIGLDGVELTSYYFPAPATPEYIYTLKRRCFELGLDVASTAIGNSFTVPVGPEREKQVALVKLWVDNAVLMGAPCARVFAGEPGPQVDGKQARGWVIECLNECCAYAGARGIMLALENHHGVVADADGILEIITAVDSPWLGMKWDTANFRTADPYADLLKCAPYAVTTHFKTEVFPNGHREPADLKRLVRILTDVGYRGYLHLEYEGLEDPAVAVPRALKELLRLTRDS